MTSARAVVSLLFSLAIVSGIPLDSEEWINQEFREALQFGTVGPVLSSIAKELDFSHLDASNSHWTEGRGPRNIVICQACRTGVSQIIGSLNDGGDPLAIINQVIDLCVNLHIANRKLCENIIMENAPALYWILMNRELSGKDVCGMMLPRYGCTTDNPDRVWEVTLPDVPKPPVTGPTLPEPGSPVLKVLHLADTHFDPLYLPGANAECPEKFFCCRADSGPLETPEAGAGKWGDYRNCDAPRWLLEALYTDIKTNHPDIDFIIWTGDIVPHNVWNTSREGNLEIIREAVQMIKDFFPDTPVFPAIGNHESHPLNVFPQPYIDNEFDISWLYDEITLLWETWLPSEVAATIAYSAFYSTLVKPGLRIISTNSNYCYSLNFWLVYDDVDPGEQLSWLAQELQMAEDAGEKVFIMAHEAPGDSDCLPTWSHQYNKIILRYESTIAGMFYGHTHNDHFMMVYDETDRPAMVGYIAQSQTPYHQLNPGYKIYTIDGHYEGSSYQVLDHENYILDLDEANANDDPRFFLLYSAKEAYGMSDLTPTSWSSLIDQMKAPNSSLFDDFFTYFTKAARPYREEGCNEDCKASLLCRLVVSDTSDKSRCDQF